MNLQPVDILLVEDNPTDEELTLRALRQARITNHIHVVRDGEEALEFVFSRGRYAHRASIREGPKVILLDLKMPKVDGLEVIRQAKSNDRTREFPIVVLTSSQEAPDLQEAYRLGANSYIVKPVDFRQFADAVGRLGLYWTVLNVLPPPNK